MCVLVHDIPLRDLEPAAKYQETMDAFKVKQPDTFQNASLVMVGGKLSEKEVELSEENKNALRDFVYDAAKRPAPPSPFERYKEIVLSLLKSLWALIILSFRSWKGKLVWAIMVIVLVVLIFSIIVSHQDKAPITIIVPATNITPTGAATNAAKLSKKFLLQNESLFVNISHAG